VSAFLGSSFLAAGAEAAAAGAAAAGAAFGASAGLVWAKAETAKAAAMIAINCFMVISFDLKLYTKNLPGTYIQRHSPTNSLHVLGTLPKQNNLANADSKSIAIVLQLSYNT
jgi:hypothetical protein